ncbi:MAG: hypothetical protein JSR44_12725 [Spirochaetes bacterium]|nr:hypothetical protein [Spirochaetota bacterium]
MKKLISILAALAIVGSLAAQRRKAPAKPAPAKAEAVKAPVAPAIAVAPVAPAEHKAHKGIGLFIEGRGTYTLGAGTSNAQGSGDQSQTSVTQQLPNTSGWGGGATIGYQILQGLGIVAGYDYRSIQSRQWSQTNSASYGGAGSSTTIQNTTNTSVLEIGLRPSWHTSHGSFYAGMGFAYVLPYNSTTTINVTNPAVAFGGLSQIQQVNNLNAGMGVYAELGYNHNIGENFYVGLGIRGLIATANNDGKTTDTTQTTSAGSTTTSTNYSSTKDATHSAYSSTGITDFGININVGVRF